MGSLKTGYWWYGDYPLNVIGTPSASTREKGEVAKRLFVDGIVRAYGKIKKDTVSDALRQEFYTDIDRVRKSEEKL